MVLLQPLRIPPVRDHLIHSFSVPSGIPADSNPKSIQPSANLGAGTGSLIVSSSTQPATITVTSVAQGSGHGISSAAVAGIVVGVIVGTIALMSFLGIAYIKSRKSWGRDDTANFGNAVPVQDDTQDVGGRLDPARVEGTVSRPGRLE